MESASDNEKLLEKRAEQIKTLSYIARSHGSLLSVEDVAGLTSVSASVTASEHRRLRHRQQNPEFHVREGFVIETGTAKPVEELASVSKALDMRARAAEYVKHARGFAALSGGKSAGGVAVSGSVSYKSVSETDDLDFFCITPKDSLWLFLAKNLLLARFYRLSGKDRPRICFSYAVDEGFALSEFSRESDALFARDALTTIVLQGDEYYRALLSHSRWMSKYFLGAYGQRTIGSAEMLDTQPGRSLFGERFLNLTLHFIIGRYIALKSSMLNRTLAKRGKSSSTFTPRIGPDHCIFESARYSQLRSMYRGFYEADDRAARQTVQAVGD